MSVTFSNKYCNKFITKSQVEDFIRANKATIMETLQGNKGLENARGWLNIDDNLQTLPQIKALAKKINSEHAQLIVVGVGGSNRTTLATVELLTENNDKVLYLGNNFSAHYFNEVLGKIKGDFYVDIIAKNFKTIEPGVAFRNLRKVMQARYGNDYNSHVIVTGSQGEGQLLQLSEQYGYTFLPFPEEVGGRFSAFSPVSLLPMAVAGVDIDDFIAGAKDFSLAQSDIENPAIEYAVTRFLLQQKGFVVENLATFEPTLQSLGQWWLQLHGETEGKCQQALLPMTTNYSEDLHAIGQFIQQGNKIICETFVNAFFDEELSIAESQVVDGFEYLDGKTLLFVNKSVYRATIDAHYDGGVPCMEWMFDKLDSYHIGQFMYINMLSSTLSAILLGVEPFDQPGVENYKKNLINLLNK